jgi:transposase
MRPHGTSDELERRRRLAVRRVQSGYTQQGVADFLGVHLRTVQRWMRSYRDGGMRALKAKPASGRPPNLTWKQEQTVLRWFRKSPREFGFPTELWTGARVVELIRRKFHKRFHPHYIIEWLAERRITPQKPEQQARERNARNVRRWLREDWLRIKKSLGVSVPIWF